MDSEVASSLSILIGTVKGGMVMYLLFILAGLVPLAIAYFGIKFGWNNLMAMSGGSGANLHSDPVPIMTLNAKLGDEMGHFHSQPYEVKYYETFNKAISNSGDYVKSDDVKMFIDDNYIKGEKVFGIKYKEGTVIMYPTNEQVAKREASWKK